MSKANILNINVGNEEQEININMENLGNSFLKIETFDTDTSIPVYDDGSKKLIQQTDLTVAKFTALQNVVNSNNLTDGKLLIYDATSNAFVSTTKTTTDLDQSGSVQTLQAFQNSVGISGALDNQIIVYDSVNDRFKAGTSNLSHITPHPTVAQKRVLIGTGSEGYTGFSNFVWDNTTGRLGVNTVAPQYSLDTTGDINFTGNLKSNGTSIAFSQPSGQVVVGTGTNLNSYSSLFWDSLNSRLGVGTNIPSTSLTVQGTTTSTLFSGDGSNLSNTITLQQGGSNQTLGRTINFNNTTTINAIKNTSNYSFELTGNMNNLSLYNIGSGVSGSNFIRFAGLAGDASGFHTIISERFYDQANEGSELFLGKGNENGSYPDRIRLSAPQILLQTYSNLTTVTNAETIATQTTNTGISIRSNGFVGIAGTVSPAYALDINGDINYTGSFYKNGTLFKEMTGDYTDNRLLIGSNSIQPKTNANLTYSNGALNAGYFDFTKITEGINIRGTATTNVGLQRGILSLYDYTKSVPSIQLQASDSNSYIFMGGYLNNQGVFNYDALGTANTYGYIRKSPQLMQIVNIYNGSVQNLITSSNDGVSPRLGINGAVNAAYSNTIYGSTNISGTLFLNGVQMEGMAGDYTTDRILLGNGTEPKTVAGLYYTGDQLYVKGQGVGGTIRIAPNSDNLETSIKFYTSASYGSTTAEGNIWTVGLASWGTGASNFSIGRNNPASGENSALTILANGNVGINSLTPAEKLSVVGNVRLNDTSPKIILKQNTNDQEDGAGILFQNSGSFYSWSIRRYLETGDGDSANTKMLFDAGSGNDPTTFPTIMSLCRSNAVGINTKSPIGDLHINGTTTTTTARITNTSSTNGVTIKQISSGTVLNNEDNGTLTIQRGSSNNFVINSNNNIAIGTVGTKEFAEPFEIYPTVAGTATENARISFDFVNDSGSTGRANINIYQNAGIANEGQLNFFAYPNRPAGASVQIASIDSNFSSHMVFRTALTGNSGSNTALERMRITPAGNVGINNSVPAYNLDVGGDINFTGNLRSNGTIFSGGGISVPAGQVVFGTGGSATGESLFIWNSTNKRLGINTATPLYTADITGTLRTTGDAIVNNLTVNGNIDLTQGELSNVNQIRFRNIETSNVSTPSNGLIGYDLNFFATGEAGNPDFIDIGTQAVGGICIYNDDGWAGIVDSHNMKGLDAKFNSVSSTTTIHASNGFTTGSTTLVTNLNADLLDGQQGSYYLTRANHTGTLAVSQGGTGATTFTSGRVLIGNGTSSITTDTLQWDTTNNRLGVNNTSPLYTLDVSGTMNVTAVTTLNGNVTVGGTLFVEQGQTDGSIRISPETNGQETGIGFYYLSNRGQSSAGDLWVVGQSSWGSGARNFAIGANTTGGVMYFGNNGEVSIGSNSHSNTFDSNVLTIQNSDNLSGTGLKILSGANNTQAVLSMWEVDDSWGYRVGYFGQTDQFNIFSYNTGLEQQKMQITHDGAIIFNNSANTQEIRNWGDIRVYEQFPNVRLQPRTENGASNDQTDRGNIIWHNTGGNSACRIGFDGLNNKLLYGFGSVGGDAYTTLTTTHEFYSNGTAKKSDGTTTWGTISDRRLKKDITPYLYGLNEIIQVEPISYIYNGLGNTVQTENPIVGVIAQDIKNIFPNTVSTYNAKLNPTDENTTELYQFNPHELLFSSINAFKELNTKNNEQDKTINDLQNTIETLTQRIEALEQQNISHST